MSNIISRLDKLNFYLETQIVSEILSTDSFIKNAEPSAITGLIDKVKGYVGNHIDPNNKVDSLINILAPGAISTLFGGGWLGYLLGGVASFFHIDVAGILHTIYDGIKSLLSGGKPVSSPQIDGIVTDAVQQHSGGTEIKASFSNFDLRKAKLLKNDLLQYKINKNAAFSSTKSNAVSILSKVLGWIFKVAIASAGLMVAGDVVNKIIGRPNAIDGTLQNGKNTPTPQSTKYISSSTQTKFPINKNYRSESYNSEDSPWIERVSNDPSSISRMIINFAKEVYSGLDNLDQEIENTIGFRKVKDNIVWYNHATPGASLIFIPKYFTSKKQIVDLFIDDVASAQNTTNDQPDNKDTSKEDKPKGILL